MAHRGRPPLTPILQEASFHARLLGRERSEASNFNAALYEHLQYLKRKRVAEARRREFEEREQREWGWGGKGGGVGGRLLVLLRVVGVGWGPGCTHKAQGKVP